MNVRAFIPPVPNYLVDRRGCPDFLVLPFEAAIGALSFVGADELSGRSSAGAREGCSL